MADSRQLYELQGVDLELDRDKRRLQEIAAALGDDGPLVALRDRIIGLEGQVANVGSQQAELDQEIAALNGRITQAEQKMYSGTVQNPRELADLQADIAQHARQRSEQEDHLLVVLDQLDGLQRELESVTTELRQTEAQWQTDQEALAQEQVRLDAEVSELSPQRDGLAHRVPPTDLATYDKVRRSHNGRAVARVERGMCESCRVGLPMRQLQEIRTAAVLSRCTTCGLILLAE